MIFSLQLKVKDSQTLKIVFKKMPTLQSLFSIEKMATIYQMDKRKPKQKHVIKSNIPKYKEVTNDFCLKWAPS